MSDISSLWPLCCSSPETFVISGKSVAQHKQERLPDTLIAEPNTWISTADLSSLEKLSDATLVSKDGETLAIKGNGEEKLTAQSSFIILYPWNFLNIAEEIIKEIKSDNISGEIHLHRR